METNSFSDRTFQLWEYHVSHGSLLIRSPRGEDRRSNIDIICTGVEYLDVPRFLRGLEIAAPTLHEVQDLSKRVGKQLTSQVVHILASAGERFRIVSGTFSVDENEVDIFESPFDR